MIVSDLYTLPDHPFVDGIYGENLPDEEIAAAAVAVGASVIEHWSTHCKVSDSAVVVVVVVIPYAVCVGTYLSIHC